MRVLVKCTYNTQQIFVVFFLLLVFTRIETWNSPMSPPNPCLQPITTCMQDYAQCTFLKVQKTRNDGISKHENIKDLANMALHRNPVLWEIIAKIGIKCTTLALDSPTSLYNQRNFQVWKSAQSQKIRSYQRNGRRCPPSPSKSMSWTRLAWFYLPTIISQPLHPM